MSPNGKPRTGDQVVPPPPPSRTCPAQRRGYRTSSRDFAARAGASLTLWNWHGQHTQLKRARGPYQLDKTVHTHDSGVLKRPKQTLLKCANRTNNASIDTGRRPDRHIEFLSLPGYTVQQRRSPLPWPKKKSTSSHHAANPLEPPKSNIEHTQRQPDAIQRPIEAVNRTKPPPPSRAGSPPGIFWNLFGLSCHAPLLACLPCWGWNKDTCRLI